MGSWLFCGYYVLVLCGQITMLVLTEYSILSDRFAPFRRLYFLLKHVCMYVCIHVSLAMEEAQIDVYSESSQSTLHWSNSMAAKYQVLSNRLFVKDPLRSCILYCFVAEVLPFLELFNAMAWIVFTCFDFAIFVGCALKRLSCSKIPKMANPGKRYLKNKRKNRFTP